MEATQYRTTHIHLAAALLTMGLELTDLEKDPNRNLSIFVFKPMDSIDRASVDFWADRLLLDPLDYFHNLRTLKNRIAELRNAK